MAERYTWGGNGRDRFDCSSLWSEPEREIALTIRADTRCFEAALRQVATSMHRFSGALMWPYDRCRHRRRCAICNPAGFPKPLKVNGADYQRRRNNRRKRA